MKNNKLEVLVEKNWLLPVFVCFFYTSWAYCFNSIGAWTCVPLGLLKNGLTLTLMLILALLLSYKRLRMDNFAWLCFLWVLLCVFLWGVNQEDVYLYARRIGQMTMFFLLVSWMRVSQFNPLEKNVLKKWYSAEWSAIVVVLMICLYLGGWLFEDIVNGFGNSRVNFSIWLTQLVALAFISKGELKNKSSVSANIYVLILITPVYALQNMSGGRSGMLGTLVLALLFLWNRLGWRGAVMAVLWLFFVSKIISGYNFQITQANNLDVFRNTKLPEEIFSSNLSTWVQSAISYVDQISSYRISIIVTAFSTLSMTELFYGVGVGKFQGWAPTYLALGMMEVHNVLLKILGEFGVAGFLLGIGLVFLSIVTRVNNKSSDLMFVQYSFILMAMVHPDLLFTSINNSIVYILTYALLLKSSQLSQGVNNKYIAAE